MGGDFWERRLAQLEKSDRKALNPSEFSDRRLPVTHEFRMLYR